MIVVLRKRRQPGFERAGKPFELLLSPRVSADAPPNRAAHTRAKAAVLDLQWPGLCETQTLRWREIMWTPSGGRPITAMPRRFPFARSSGGCRKCGVGGPHTGHGTHQQCCVEANPVAISAKNPAGPRSSHQIATRPPATLANMRTALAFMAATGRPTPWVT